MATSWTFDVLEKTIHAYKGKDSNLYSLEDVSELLGLSELRVWAAPPPTTDIEGVTCIKSAGLRLLILASRNIEARAYLYRRIHGVGRKTIGGAYTSPRVMYDARDLAICLGYANGDPAVTKYFFKKKSLTEYGAYKLAAGSKLPDAEEFVDKLFDEERLTHIWTHMKFGPRENNIIPFVYKGISIRTFAEEEEGGFLFTLEDVCQALGIEKGPRFGRGMKKVRVVDYYYGEDKRRAVITEEGLEFLLERVDSPEVGEFRRWVDSKILPSLKQPHPWGRPTRLVLRDGRWVPRE